VPPFCALCQGLCTLSDVVSALYSGALYAVIHSVIVLLCMVRCYSLLGGKLYITSLLHNRVCVHDNVILRCNVVHADASSALCYVQSTGAVGHSVSNGGVVHQCLVPPFVLVDEVCACSQ
jgi:hypothetical protein